MWLLPMSDWGPWPSTENAKATWAWVTSRRRWCATPHFPSWSLGVPGVAMADVIAIV